MREHGTVRRVVGAVGALALLGALLATSEPARAGWVTPEQAQLVSTRADGSPFDQPSDRPVMSADGRFVVFDTETEQDGSWTGFGFSFVPGGSDPTETHLVWKDRLLGTVVQIDSQARAVHADMSADGRWVVYERSVSRHQPPEIWMWDAESRASRPLLEPGLLGGVAVDTRCIYCSQAMAVSQGPRISADGSTVVFATKAGLAVGDTNDELDIYAVTVGERGVERLTGAVAGGGWVTAVSADGRQIVYSPKWGTQLRHLDRDTGVDTLLRSGLGYFPASELALSPDGRYVAFYYDAPAPWPGEGEVRLLDRSTGTEVVLGEAAHRFHGYGAPDVPHAHWPHMGRPHFSADGAWLAFSTSSALVAADTDSHYDTYRRHLPTGTTELVSAGGTTSADIAWSAMDASGRHIAVAAQADGLAGGDANGTWDIVAFDLGPCHDGEDGCTDLDGDGLTDGDEAAIGASPASADTDGDGLHDGAEVWAGSDPAVADTDGDGVADGAEVASGSDPVRADTDCDGLPDSVDALPQSPWSCGTAGDHVRRADGNDVVVTVPPIPWTVWWGSQTLDGIPTS